MVSLYSASAVLTDIGIRTGTPCSSARLASFGACHLARHPKVWLGKHATGRPWGWSSDWRVERRKDGHLSSAILLVRCKLCGRHCLILRVSKHSLDVVSLLVAHAHRMQHHAKWTGVHMQGVHRQLEQV